MKPLALLVLPLAFAACQAAPAAREAVAPPGTVTHVVVCALKDPHSAQDRAKLVAATKAFVGKVPGLRRVAAGPRLASGRPFVQDDFDLALTMVFDNPAALEAYNRSPLHQQAVREILAPLTTRVRVYDFLSE